MRDDTLALPTDEQPGSACALPGTANATVELDGGCRADLTGRRGRGVRGSVERGSATRVGSVGGGGPVVWEGVTAEGLF